jgi:hypothetical protein
MKTATIHTTTGSTIYYVQRCLLCDNTRRLPDGMTYCTSPWVCDDCKEAIAFLKDFKKEYAKAREMLNKNVK